MFDGSCWLAGWVALDRSRLAGSEATLAPAAGRPPFSRKRGAARGVVARSCPHAVTCFNGTPPGHAGDRDRPGRDGLQQAFLRERQPSLARDDHVVMHFDP